MTTEKLAIDGGTPVRTKPFGPRHFLGDPEKEQLIEVIDKAPTMWNSGYKRQEFEDGFAKRHGVKYAVATDSGTGSLHAAVAAVNPEPGDEIITAPATDIGSVLGIVLQNAIPVFSDWAPGGYLNQSASGIESRITERTRAIMVIHLFGYPVDMDAVMDVARRHDLPVIEDCSQAHLSEYKGRLVGTIGDMGCFSLGGKPLTAGGGGILITDNEELARRAKGFANKGSEYDEGLRNSLRPTSERQGSSRGYSFLGDFHPMSDLMAAVGVAQLGRIDDYVARRRAAGAIMEDMLWEVPGIMPQKKASPDDRSGFYVHGFSYDEDEVGVSLEQFTKAVKAEGAPVGGPYLRGMGLYRYPIFAEERTYGNSRYPFVDEQGNRRVDYNALHLRVLEEELPTTLTVGGNSSYTEEDATDIATAIRKVALHYAARR
jgi:perosamine synthetase